METKLEEKKIALIHWLANIKDPSVIDELINFRNRINDDWWDEISENEKESIQKGLNDLAEGNITSHSEVKKLYEKCL